MINIDVEKYNYIIIGSSFSAQPIVQKLSKKKHNKILVLEGGSADENDFSEKLTENLEIGEWKSGYYWSSHWIRAYGGTSRRWSGMIAPLDKSDFTGNNIIKPWPISFFDVERYYQQAAEFLYRNDEIIKNQGNISQNLEYKPYSLPSRLKTFYDFKDDFKYYLNVDLLLNTHLIKILIKDGKKIDGIQINLNGNQKILKIDNQKIIIACGGLGNAQILLNSNLSKESNLNYFNENVLGKNLMEHPHHYVGYAFISEDTLLKKPYNFNNFTNGYSLSSSLRRNKNLLNCTFEFRISKPKATELEKISKIKAFYENNFKKKLIFCRVFSRSEQEPKTDSYIKLINDENKVGLRKLEINFKISNYSKTSLYDSSKFFSEEIYKNKLGLMKVNEKMTFNPLFGGGHTMGTTKMGESIKDSVVDKNCKVHNINNLYISGSSNFSTGGAANPTLTIVALAFRLGDYLLNNEKT